MKITPREEEEGRFRSAPRERNQSSPGSRCLVVTANFVTALSNPSYSNNDNYHGSGGGGKEMR